MKKESGCFVILLTDMKSLVIIPARAGSKGLPGKSLKKFLGKPLIAHTILAAQKSRYRKSFDIICSTDGNDIAKVARKWKCDVPFIRPKHLATDQAKSIDVVIHALNYMEKKNGYRYDYVILLQLTSPLRNAKHLDEAMGIVLKKKAAALVSVTPPSQSPFYAHRLNNKGQVIPLIKHNYHRRQDMPLVVNFNGAIYITKRNIIINKHDFLAPKTFSYVMDRRFSVDIDTKEDLQLAEFFAKAK